MSGFGKDPIPGFTPGSMGIPTAAPMQDSAAGLWRLRVLNGPCAGREFTLTELKTRVGRSDPPAVRVEIDLGECELGATTMVSRLHAELLLVDETVQLVDLGSRNGTWVNEQPVGYKEPGRVSEPIVVPPGSKICFANLELELVNRA